MTFIGGALLRGLGASVGQDLKRLLAPASADRELRLSRYGTAYIALLTVSIISLIVVGGYWSVNVLAYNYVANDRWCDIPTEGLGLHCFSDFHQFVLIPPGEMLRDVVNTSQGRSPIGGLISDGFSLLGALSPRGALVGWLVLSAILMALPMVWATRKLAAPQRIQAVLLLGVLTLPFWATLDRGQQMALAVPLFYVYGVALIKGRFTWVALASALLFLVKPYLILLAIPLLFTRRIRPVGVWIETVIAGLLVSFLPYGVNAGARAGSWISQLLGAREGQAFRFDTSPTTEAITVSFPYDYSLAGATTDLANRLSPIVEVAGVLESIPRLTFVAVGFSAGAIALLSLVRTHIDPVRFVVAVLAAASLAITPAYSYQFAFALTGIALLVAFGSSNGPQVDEPSPRRRIPSLFVPLILLLSLAPLIVPLNWPDPLRNAPGSEYPQIDNFYPFALVMLWYVFIGVTIAQGLLARLTTNRPQGSGQQAGRALSLVGLSVILLATGVFLWSSGGKAEVRSVNLFGFEKVPDTFASAGSGYGKSFEVATDLYVVGGAERTLYFPADPSGEAPQCLGGQIRFAVESIDIRLNDAVGQEEVVESLPPVGGVEHRLVLTPDGRSFFLESDSIQSVTLDRPVCLNVGGAELAAAPTESLFVEVGTPHEALTGVRALAALLIIGGLGAMAAAWFTRRRQRATSLSI